MIPSIYVISFYVPQVIVSSNKIHKFLLMTICCNICMDDSLFPRSPQVTERINHFLVAQAVTVQWKRCARGLSWRNMGRASWTSRRPDETSTSLRPWQLKTIQELLRAYSSRGTRERCLGWVAKISSSETVATYFARWTWLNGRASIFCSRMPNWRVINSKLEAQLNEAYISAAKKLHRHHLLRFKSTRGLNVGTIEECNLSGL